MVPDVNVPVLIVGGGGCGLTSSILLSELGVETLLVERHDSTSPVPKAHYLNQRTMEIFRQFGIAEPIVAAGAPLEAFGKATWRTSLGGDGPLDGKVIHAMDAFGGGQLRERYLRDSPSLPTNLPQVRLEPILRRMAEDRAPGRIRFGHELVDFTQDDTGVTATIEPKNGTAYRVRCQYLIGADGGRFVGQKLGVVLAGSGRLIDIIGCHFKADLSAHFSGDSVITWLIDPDGGGPFGSGALLPMGPTWGRNSEEWVLHFTFPPDDPQRMFDHDVLVAHLRRLLKIPDLDVEVLNVSRWGPEGALAERFRAGRVFLAGDAAHRTPPTTALGLNSAIHDVHNLAWKLAAVLDGTASPALLDSYETERRPVDAGYVDWAMFTFVNHTVINAGLGLSPNQTPEQRHQAIAALLADTPMGATPGTCRSGDRNPAHGVPLARHRARIPIRRRCRRTRRHRSPTAGSDGIRVPPDDPARPPSATRVAEPWRPTGVHPRSRGQTRIRADDRSQRHGLDGSRLGRRGRAENSAANCDDRRERRIHRPRRGLGPVESAGPRRSGPRAPGSSCRLPIDEPRARCRERPASGPERSARAAAGAGGVTRSLPGTMLGARGSAGPAGYRFSLSTAHVLSGPNPRARRPSCRRRRSVTAPRTSVQRPPSERWGDHCVQH